MDAKTQFAVVGATGTVGREVLGALFDAGVNGTNITALGTERSEGDEIDYGDETLEVEKVSDDSFRGIKVAILAAPEDAARTLAPKAQAAGAWVIDVSPAFRTDPNVPLILPALNLKTLEAPLKGRVISTPGPVTAMLLTALEPLRVAFGIKRAIATAMLAASSMGERGVRSLEKEVADLLSGRENEPELFPHRLAFNVIPQVGDFTGAWSREERSWREEAARIWTGQPEAPVLSGTALQIPTFFGHAASISVELAQTPSEADVRQALRGASSLKVLDSPEEKIYPMPMLITADPTVHVGRVRATPGAPGTFELFAVIDNAGRGAALNAVEIAMALAQRAS